MFKKVLSYFLLAGLVAAIFTGCTTGANKIVVSPYEGKWSYIREVVDGNAHFEGLNTIHNIIEIRKAKLEERNKKDRDEFVVNLKEGFYYRVKGYPKKNNDGVVEVLYKWRVAPAHTDKVIGVLSQESVMNLIRIPHSPGYKLLYAKEPKEHIEYVSPIFREFGRPNPIYRRLVDAEVANIKEVIQNDIKNSKYISSLMKSCKAKGEVLDIKFID